MHNIGLMALDLGVRGAAAGLFLMIVIVLLRIRPVNAIIVLSMALAAAGAAYAIVTAPFFPKQWMGWSLPIMVGNPVMPLGPTDRVPDLLVRLSSVSRRRAR